MRESDALNKYCPLLKRMCMGSACMGWTWIDNGVEIARVPVTHEPVSPGWTQAPKVRDGYGYWQRQKPNEKRFGACAFMQTPTMHKWDSEEMYDRSLAIETRVIKGKI